MKKLLLSVFGLFVTLDLLGVSTGIVPVSIRCPEDIKTWTCNTNGQVVTFQPHVVGGCLPVQVGCVPPSGGVFPVGTTVVTCGVRDACEGQDRCEFKITVVLDTEKPRILCPD